MQSFKPNLKSGSQVRVIEEHKEWLRFEGASQEEIETLNSSASFDLPSHYLDLLKHSNGGEGPLPVQPLYFVLDSVEEATNQEAHKKYKEMFPGYFVFGGSGGGEYIAVEIDTGKIVALDSTNNNLEESVLVIASTFSEFLGLIGSQGD